ncbi:MAG: DUF3237 domain-containing protein [Anaerolineales bacterium]|nr:DUF3237 domain-containing protein [Anaerolineales bacterium]
MSEAITLKHFCDLYVKLSPIVELGNGRSGQRRIFPIIGGEVRGERVNGTILNIGADFQTILPDGTAELVARYAFRTDDGAVIEINNSGFRHGPPEVIAALARGEEVEPSSYYMRTQARLETGDPRYAWVNNRLFIGSGSRQAESVKIALYEIC